MSLPDKQCHQSARLRHGSAESDGRAVVVVVVSEDSFNEIGVPGFQSLGVPVDAEKGMAIVPSTNKYWITMGKFYNAYNDAGRIEEWSPRSIFLSINGRLGVCFRCL